MRKHHAAESQVRFTLIAGVAIAALTASTGALGQAPAAAPPPAPTDASDIIVTAQRRAERLESVPVAITALSAETIARSGVQRITDLGQIATSVQVNRAGAFTQPAIRGITTLTLGFGFENNVAVYVDGFYQPDMVTINSDLANLASLQVLKGPQGTLYGRNATAGAIVIDTLAPSRELTANGQISYGRFNDLRLQGYVSGPLSDTVAVGIAAYYRRSDGYIRDIGADPLSGADDTNAAPLKNTSIRAKLLFTPSTALKVTLGFNHGFVEDSRGLVYTINSRPSAALPTPPGRATLRDTASPTIPADARARADEATLKIELDTGIGKLTSYTGYAKRNSHSGFDFDASRAVVTQSITDDINQYTAQQTLDLAIDAIPNLDLIVGGFFYDDKLRSDNGRSYSGTVSPAGLLRTQFVRLTSRSYAAYIDGTFHISDRLFLTGGLRYSNEKRTISYYELPGLVTAIAPPGSNAATFDAFTPRAVLRYEIAPRTNVYASYSQGFRAGVFNPTVVANPALVLPVNPEKLTAYEIGFKTASPKFRFDAAIYYYNFRDLQVGVTIPSPLNPNTVIQLISNAKRAESYGAEAQLTYTPTPDLTVRAGAAYVHARYTDFSNATGTGINAATGLNVTGQVQNWNGQEMARAPAFTANLGLSYETDLAGGRLTASANGSYTASYVVANPSLFGPLAPAELQNVQRYRQDGYGLLNAQLNWTDASGHYTVGVYGDNITNTRYNFVLSGGAFGDYSQGNEPATYGLRAGFKF